MTIDPISCGLSLADRLTLPSVPGIAFYMSLWYPRENAQLRLSIVFAAASMAGAFSGLLAYLIDKTDGVGNLEGWRWM